MEENYSAKTEQAERLKITRTYLRLTQTEFGSKIGLNKTQVKDRESGLVKISPSEAKNIEFEYKINSSWILTGQGSMMISGEGTRVAESGESYSPSPTSRDSDNHIKTSDLLVKTAQILESQSIYRTALRSNIEAFHNALNSEIEIKNLKDRMGTIEDEMKELRDRLKQSAAG